MLLEERVLLAQLRREMRPSDYLHKIVSVADTDVVVRKTITTRSEEFQAFRDKAASLDHDHVGKICERMYGWSPNKTRYVRSQYNVFWAICGINLQLDIYETLDVDNYWHAHVLHTQQYREDCDYVFGRFLEHVPCL